MEKAINYRSPSTRNANASGHLLAFALAILVLAVDAMAECPRLCECKWKSGKESVLCLSANLSAIPDKLDAGTQILDLTRNEIATIANDAFQRANLLNVQKLYLAKCHLKTIERYAFRKLSNLVELDLSDNLMGAIPSLALESIPELRELRLIGNPIQRIANDAFVRVPQLIRLELSNCRIATVEVRAFAGLETSLEWLKLDGNRLVGIHEAALVSLQNLHGLELAGNQWNCSCSLRPLREWMIRENIPFNIPPMCQSPARLYAKSWDKIDLDEFACVPTIVAADGRAHGVEGKNITMGCIVNGVPEPSVRWMVRNRVIANLTGSSYPKLPASQGRKLYMVNLQQNASNLTILAADLQDAGTYTCAAENKAGKVEASVTLAVARRPADSMLGSRLIVATVVAIGLFVVASVLLAICVCTLKRRKKLGRWNTQGRRESYEKIELNHKPNYGDGKAAAARCERGGTFIKAMAENGISVGGQPSARRRNGDYRNVPSEDNDTDCFEENVESSNATISNIKLEDEHRIQLSWNVATTSAGSAISKSAKNKLTQNQPDGVNMKPLKLAENDLHIPRLIEFSDSTPDSSIDPYDVPKRGASLMGSSNGGTAAIATKSNAPWTHIVNRKRAPAHANVDGVYGVQDRLYQNISDGRASESDCDSDRKYPDLLDINGVSLQANLGPAMQSHSQHPAGAVGPYKKATSSNPFCTLPRKKHAFSAGRKAITSESQATLLTDTSSQFGSSTFADTDPLGRRMSNESFNNFSLAINLRSGQPSNGRSNSFLNLTTQSAGGKPINTNVPYAAKKRVPSLPSSPCKEQSKAADMAETPLLDFASLAKHKQNMLAAAGASASASHAYDYHAAQLERFLEEYRNLQEQLCKMKETCESIRKKEAPLRTTAGNSIKVADPLMFSALSTNAGISFADGSATPKGILKNKILLPNQPPDPPPYWLHRNAMLKKLQDPDADFFNS